MAEAFASLAVAANIVQFVELGFRMSKIVIDTYQSADGLANPELSTGTNELQHVCNLLKQDKTAKNDLDMARLLTLAIDTADKLRKELSGLKFSSSTTTSERLGKLIVSMRAVRRKRKIEALQSRIVEIRQQVLMRLQLLIFEQRASFSAISGQLGTLETASKQSEKWDDVHATKLEAMARKLEDLLAAQATWNGREDAFKSFTEDLTKFMEQARNHDRVLAILKSLHFKQLRVRQNEIPIAHQNTFEWMFNNPGGHEFRTWLRESSGIFWITGKPGSGKSTLLKFLLGHQQLTRLLSDWARDRPVLIASHFFWGVGTDLQKSQEGLLRSLLFQVLVNQPELIPQVCPERYFQQFRHLESWTLEELQLAFGLLTRSTSLPARLFLLIDGLDEYWGEPMQIAKFIHTFAASPDIKVCCASRPWTEFESSFRSAAGQIQIHLLTENDIRIYVQDCLEEENQYKRLCAKHPLDAKKLADTISSRAQGVFFWVYLVVKSLLRGLEHDDDLQTLQRRLEQLPSDLNAFFEKMLLSIEPIYQQSAFSILNVLLIAKSALPLQLFPHLDEVRVGIAELHMQKPTASIGSAKWEKRFLSRHLTMPEVFLDPDSHSRTRNRVLSQCRDLVQVLEAPDKQGRTTEITYTVGFLHRNVVDFLCTPKAQDLLNEAKPPMPTTWPDEDRYRLLLCESFLSLVLPETGLKDADREKMLLWVILLIAEISTPLAARRVINLLVRAMDPTSSSWDYALNTFQQSRRIELLLVTRFGLQNCLSLVDGDPKSDAIFHHRLCLTQALRPQAEIGVGLEPSFAWSRRINLEVLRHFVRQDRVKGSETLNERVLAEEPIKTMETLVTRLSQEGLFTKKPLTPWRRSIFETGARKFSNVGLTVWEEFLISLHGPTRPDNAFEVCKLLIESGLVMKMVPYRVCVLLRQDEPVSMHDDPMSMGDSPVVDLSTCWRFLFRSDAEVMALSSAFPPRLGFNLAMVRFARLHHWEQSHKKRSLMGGVSL